MKVLSKHSESKKDTSTILTLSAQAKVAKKKDPTISDGTIGMLYDETGQLMTFRSVNQALFELNNEEKYAYSTTKGNPDFQEAVLRWVFRDAYEEFTSEYGCRVIATPGGSGAISNTFSDYLNPNDVVLLPNYMWSNYIQFAYENFASYETYDLFDGTQFNLKSVRNQMLRCKKRQGRVVFVLNDPCHNPTGYCMTDAEWENLIAIIAEVADEQTPFVFLYDLAYIDYDDRGFEDTRKHLRLLKKLPPYVLSILAFSGSKTLGLYGLRVGAQIAVCPDQEILDDFERAAEFSARAKWSMATNLGMNVVSKVFLNAERRQSFEEELEQARNLLKLRSRTFLEEAEKAGLKTLPFTCGFFITIPAPDPQKTYENLVRRKVYIVPMDSCLRVSISSLSVEECRKLPKIIKECL